MDSNDKPYLRCRKCQEPFHFPQKKYSAERFLSAIVPFKKFFCAKCLKTRYVIITDEKYSQYKKVV
jgi:hypothetical protein